MKKRNFVISIWVLLSVLFSANVFAASEKRVDWNGRFEGEEEFPGLHLYTRKFIYIF